MKLEIKKESYHAVVQVKLQFDENQRPKTFNLDAQQLQMLIKLLDTAARADSFAFATIVQS